MIWDFLIDRLLEEQHPEVEHEKCIYKITNGKNCSICRDNCPMDAISLYNKGVSIDEKLCEDCGICKTMCPSQAINFKGLGELDLVSSIKGKKNIVIGCSKKDVNCNLKLSCLNAFHPELLAALFIDNIQEKFYFNLTMCDGCSLGEKNHLFRESLEKAVSFLEALGMKPKYELNLNEWELRELTDEIYSRRDLFLNLKKNTSNLAYNAIDSVVGENKGLNVRLELINAIKKNNIQLNNLNGNIFFNNYEVDNNCNACKKCEDICPVKAWNIEEDEDKILLLHKGSICLNCTLCVDICPSKAIKSIENIPVNNLGQNIKKKLNIRTCPDCGDKYIFYHNDKVKCDICNKKEELRKKIRNMDKNI